MKMDYENNQPDKCSCCVWAWGSAEDKTWWCKLCLNIEECLGPRG